MAPRPSPVPVHTAESDRPGIGRLSLIALCCFALGLAWPLLAGLDFVQRPPGSSPLKPDESERSPPESEPDPKPSPSPSPRPGTPVQRDQGVRAAAHLAPVSKPQKASEESSPEVDDRLVVMSGQATVSWKAALVRESPSG